MIFCSLVWYCILTNSVSAGFSQVEPNNPIKSSDNIVYGIIHLNTVYFVYRVVSPP